MDYLRLAAGVLLPYLAAATFLAGTIYRFYAWKKLPSPAMTLFPAPPTERANTLNTLRETLTFRSLYRGDRFLWTLAWTFHAVLALILLGHSRVFTNADRLLMRTGMSEPGIKALSGTVGGLAGVVIIAATALLLLRRLAVQRVREITGTSDCLILLLLGAIILTGNWMRFGGEFDLTSARAYFAALVSFRDVAGAAALKQNLFVFHMSLAWVLIMILPFSKLLHFGGFFFTHQLIRKN